MPTIAVLLPTELVLRAIQEEDQLKKLSLGDKCYLPLKNFLIKDATAFHKGNFAKTYVLIPLNSTSVRVWGYITLMNSEIVLEKDQEPPDLTDVYKVFPTVKIARLTVDKALQGNGYGQEMIAWCISLVKYQIMPYVGCRYLTVDAKRESVGFYEKLGFVKVEMPLGEEEDHPSMFFDVHKN